MPSWCSATSWRTAFRARLRRSATCCPRGLRPTRATWWTDEKEPEAEPTVDEVLDYWLKNRMVTAREHALLKYLMGILDVSEDDKRQVLRQAVKKMVQAK